MRTTLTIAVLTALIALAPAAAQAGTECQSAQAAGTGSSAADAWQDWQDNVAGSYGAAWAKLDLAQNKGVLPFTNPFPGGSTIYTAMAIPCRAVRVTAGLANNVGNLDMMQGDDANPTAPMAVKKYKLAKFQ